MGLVNQSATLQAGSQSFTNLVKSPGDSPNGQWMLDQTLAPLFKYPYAVNRRLSDVVIPKGTIVGVTGRAKDYLTGKYRNTIGFASSSTNAIGIAPYSFFNKFKLADDGVTKVIAHDEFGADDFQLAIETRSYIEVPFLPNPEDVFTYTGGVALTNVNGMKMMYGCATNIDKATVDTTAALQAGDYVKAGPYGKFVRWVPGTDAAQLIVGQVLELDVDMPPLGWLKYVEPAYEGSDSARENNVIEPAPASGPIYDPNYTWPYTEESFGRTKEGAWKTIGNGIAGLTDGAKMALTSRIQRFTIAAHDTNEDLQLDVVAKVDPTSIKVYVGASATEATGFSGTGTTPSAPYYTYDADAQKINLTIADAASTTAVTVTYTVDPKSIIGVPASWNFAGSVGVARILLKL